MAKYVIFIGRFFNNEQDHQQQTAEQWTNKKKHFCPSLCCVVHQQREKIEMNKKKTGPSTNAQHASAVVLRARKKEERVLYRARAHMECIKNWLNLFIENEHY